MTTSNNDSPTVTTPVPGPARTDTASPFGPNAPVNPLAHLPIPFQPTDFNLKGYHLEASVKPDQVVLAAQHLEREGFALDTITGVDWMAANEMEVIYDYFHPIKPLRVVVRSRIPRDKPAIETISNVYPGANWHERETHDFFGIGFIGHPNLLPFLLPEDATYHPLRKDFTACS
jgi:NADH-quinone oxidoreductase subunit C